MTTFVVVVGHQQIEEDQFREKTNKLNENKKKMRKTIKWEEWI